MSFSISEHSSVFSVHHQDHFTSHLPQKTVALDNEETEQEDSFSEIFVNKSCTCLLHIGTVSSMSTSQAQRLALPLFLLYHSWKFDFI